LLESLDWLAAEQTRRDIALAELDAELATLPAAPDPDEYVTTGARLRTIGDTLPEMDESTLTALLAELGSVQVSGDGVRLLYHDTLAAFVPAPCVVDVG
jgi:hypothetical protein